MSSATAAPEWVVVKGAESKQSSPEPGLTRYVGAYNDKLFLAEHRMEKGWVGAAHSHPHEQIVRGGVEHQASAVEPTHVIDVFTPCRNDYL
jgi:hypothetical protein